MVTIDEVRALASTLPRSTEALVHDRVKFRVGRIVYLAFSRDETQMGFGFPKEEREALVASEPDKFLMPTTSDLRLPLGRGSAGGDRCDGDARARPRRLAHGGAEVRGRRVRPTGRALAACPSLLRRARVGAVEVPVPDHRAQPPAIVERCESEPTDRTLPTLVIGVQHFHLEEPACRHGLEEGGVVGVVGISEATPARSRCHPQGHRDLGSGGGRLSGSAWS